MLQFIRDHATGWIAWGIVVLICVPFALWGIYDYLSPNVTVAVATVNGTELTVNQYQQEYQRHRDRLRRLLGGQLNLAGLDEGLLRQQSLESMIREELLVQAAAAEGLRIGDEQLARAIHVQEPFQTDGEFDVERYEIWLRNQGYSPGGFEFGLRRSLVTEQMLSGVGGSAFVTNAEKRQLSRLASQTRSFFELTIPVSRFADVESTEEDIERYFADNRASLVIAETVGIAYIELSRAAIARTIEVAEDDLRALYESSRLNYTQPERRAANHILLRLPVDADESDVAQKMAAALTLRDRLGAGEDFAALAEEVSEDPGSSGNGGALGYFERGDMVPAFESAAFALQVGELSDVVRSRFGLHIIMLTDIKEGRTKTFEEAREEVQDEYGQNEAEQLYYEQLDQMEILAFEVPDSLETAAAELGLEIKNVRVVTRDGSTSDLVAADPRVIEAAFSEDVLLAGNNSGAIVIPDSRAVVVRVIEHEPSRPQTLEEARELIVARLKDEEAKTSSLRAAEEALDHLSSGGGRQSLSERLGIEWVAHTEVGRDVIPSRHSVVERVFELPRPDAGRESYAMVSSASGDRVLIALTAVIEGDPLSLASEQRQALENELASDYGRSAFDAFVQTIRDQADVVVNEESFEL